MTTTVNYRLIYRKTVGFEDMGDIINLDYISGYDMDGEDILELSDKIRLY